MQLVCVEDEWVVKQVSVDTWWQCTRLAILSGCTTDTPVTTLYVRVTDTPVTTLYVRVNSLLILANG